METGDRGFERERAGVYGVGEIRVGDRLMFSTYAMPELVPRGIDDKNANYAMTLKNYSTVTQSLWA